MSQIADCAFELIQVRTGDGARPPARGGKVEGTSEAVAAEVEQVLADLGGPVGERKRKNLGIVRRKMLDDMREGGLATSLYRALINGFRGLFRTS
ncbi:hypothetical protein FRB98_004100 [Tulasnella sp. 332]|nr:hypothetical protein FRB98_004100 [Tulasnella sp. 332]